MGFRLTSARLGLLFYATGCRRFAATWKKPRIDWVSMPSGRLAWAEKSKKGRWAEASGSSSVCQISY
jgi:hypothetical protein